MNAHPKHFGSPSGEPSITTTRPTPQQMCENSGHYPVTVNARRSQIPFCCANSIDDKVAAPRNEKGPRAEIGAQEVKTHQMDSTNGAVSPIHILCCLSKQNL